MAETVDIWAWTYKDKERFLEEGGLKKAIVDHYEDFWRCYSLEDFLGADLALHNAIDAARAVGDPRWELHLRHWRLQTWSRQSQIKRMLPEAIDLLSLSLDERVKDIPQRICAYHDVVECYVDMDPVGYYEEIKENSENILSQLPKKYPCADCARANLGRAAAAAGKIPEAERWLSEGAAHRHDPQNTSYFSSRGAIYLYLHQWENAEKAYLEASRIDREERDWNHYLWSILGLAEARLKKKDHQGAELVLTEINRIAKYETSTDLAARLLEIQGYAAELFEAPEAALSYFVRSAQISFDLGMYRFAADIALHAAELSQQHELAQPEGVLDIAASAVGQLPPASRDLYQRLTAFGRQPLLPTAPQTQEQFSADQMKEQEERTELASIEALLQAHMQGGNLPGLATTLFRLGVWHDTHDQSRAAVDYFLWSAALERLGKLSESEREDALNALKHLGTKLPDGTVTAALRAAESTPPTQLLPILSNVPQEQWGWTVQAIATEVAGKPVVEPRPESQDGADQFNAWIAHSAGLTALIVRFREQADSAKCEHWAQSLEETARDTEENIPPELRDNPEVLVVPIFIRNLAALSRGADIAEIKANTPAPFNQVIEQIEEVAQIPVWHHPDSSPIDYLVEQAVQKAVRALRVYDEHRTSRLANLVFRYELMTFDLRQHEELHSMANFLDALGTLLKLDGQQLPTLEPPLEAPYDSILIATFEAGQIAETQEPA